jgi:hypothetical protein
MNSGVLPRRPRDVVFLQRGYKQQFAQTRTVHRDLLANQVGDLLNAGLRQRQNGRFARPGVNHLDELQWLPRQQGSQRWRSAAAK